MPRGPRLDAPGILHHVRFRGIERRKIFLDDYDREDFLQRLERACEGGRAFVYAWCLMGNHVHLAIRTGARPLAKTMGGLLSGYATAFNFRHRRGGHLFQNRYKSTVVEDERYFLALVRYIHRNPVRARLVDGLEQPAGYRWTGHRALMGKGKAVFQDVDEVLGRFGERAGPARRELVKFMGGPDAKSDEKVFKGAGGGLVKSIGGLSELSEHRRGPKWAYDERILGGGSFVTRVLEQAGVEMVGNRLSEERRWNAYEDLLQKTCAKFEVEREELSAGSRRRPAAKARQVVSYLATRKLGLSCEAVSRTMNVSSPAIVKAAQKGEAALNEQGLKETDLLSDD